MDGNRLSKMVDGEMTTYLVDTNRPYAQVVREANANDALVYQYGSDLLTMESGINTYTYHTDALGSTRLLTGSFGQVADEITYDAWGEQLGGGIVTENRYLYTGEQYDSLLGDYYLRARYYDQGVGQFTQMDTWMGRPDEPTTLNKYVYGNADPANVTDPTGHFGLASFSAANSIRSTLSSIQVDVGLSLLDSAFSSRGDAQQGATNSMLLGVASLGGPSAFKLLRMLSGKFRKACAANSFTGETLVSTQFGLVPIRDINIGDKVWAYDEESGENTLQEVIHLIRGEGEKSLVDITLASGEVITATTGHPMYSVSQLDWVDAGELKLDNLLRKISGADASIVGLRKYSETADVYNLTVANDHTYFVGLDEVLGHNAGSCKFPEISVAKSVDTVSDTSRQALRNAKEANGIPKSAQPDRTIKPNTPEGNQLGLDGRNVKQYEYTNSSGQKISIRQDKAAGYGLGGAGDQKTHFNAGSAGQKLRQHHYYGD